MTLISKKTNCGEENRESMGVGQQLYYMASTVASHSCTTYHFAALPRADALVCTPTFIVGARFMVPVSWHQYKFLRRFIYFVTRKSAFMETLNIFYKHFCILQRQTIDH
jgi:hypothetical protein